MAAGAAGRDVAAREGRSRSRSASADSRGAFAEAQAALARDQTAFEAERGKRKHGAMVTRDQVLLALSGFLLFNAEGRLVIKDRVHNDKERYEVAAGLSGLAANTVKKYVVVFREHGCIVLEPPGRRGPAKPDSDTLNALNDVARDWVENLLKDESNPIWITRKYIQDFIFQQSGVFASFKRISFLCDAWGLQYGRLARAPKAHDKSRALFRRIALLQWAHRVRQGIKIYTMDESYDNVRKSLEMGWHLKGSAFAAFAVQKGAGSGPRLCWAHACCDDGTGFCVEPGTPRPALGDIETEAPTAEMMFAANLAVGDYHDNFNAAVFMKWLRNRFIPMIKAKDPAVLTGASGANLRHALRLDNAPYHVVTTPNFDPAKGDFRFDPRTLSKGDLVDAMMAVGCELVTVPVIFRSSTGDDQALFESEGATVIREIDEDNVVMKKMVDVEFCEEEKKKRGKPGYYPGVPEIQLAALEWLVAHEPGVLENDCENLLRTELNGNCVALWNGPNFPESMVVETCWSTVKMYNRAAFVNGRTMQQLWQDTGDGLYTDKVAAPLTHNYKGGHFVPANGKCPELQKYIEHVWSSPKGGCAVHIAQDKELRVGGFTSMADGVCPEDMKPLRDAPNRAAMRFLVGKHLVEDYEGIAEVLEGGDEDDDDADEV